MAEPAKKNLLRRLLRKRLVQSALRRVGGPLLLEQMGMLAAHGYWPNLRAPRRLTEHIAHLKLFDRDPRFITLADKVAVRDYVAREIGPQYLSTLFQVITHPDQLVHDQLPAQFCMKPNHGSRWVIIARDKHEHSEPDLRAKCRYWLNARFGKGNQEWWYHKISPKVMVEELLFEPGISSPPELKIWCFAGVAKLIGYHHDRFAEHTESYFDRRWNLLPWGRSLLPRPYRDPPPQWEEMIDLAERLARGWGGFRFVRVDMYALPAGRIAFGEMTFCPGAARARFQPSTSYDLEAGQYWDDGPIAPPKPPLAPRPPTPRSLEPVITRFAQDVAPAR